MTGGSPRLSALKSRTQQRSRAFSFVCAALPPKLAEAVASAGVEGGVLTIGVIGAAWASRLRYLHDTLRRKMSESMGVEIKSLRIKVVPSAKPP